MQAIKNLPQRVALVASLSLITLVTFAATARAADSVTPSDSSAVDALKAIYDAFSGGHYAYAAALGIIGIVAVLKRWSGTGSIAKWFHGDAGGTILALAAATSAALVTTLAPGNVLTWSLMKSAFLVGIGAAGGYAVIKNLVIEPLLVPLVAKYPWLQPILTIASWIFDKPSAIAEAEKKGADAVAASPGQGVTAVLGNPSELK